jgi:hypothetical protein
LNSHAIPPVRQVAKRAAPVVTLGREDEEFIMNSCRDWKEVIRLSLCAHQQKHHGEGGTRARHARHGRDCHPNRKQLSHFRTTISANVECRLNLTRFATLSPQGGGSGAACTTVSGGSIACLPDQEDPNDV